MKVENELNDKVIKFLKNLIKELEEDAEAYAITHSDRKLRYRVYLPFGTTKDILLSVQVHLPSDMREPIIIKMNELEVNYPVRFGWELHSALLKAYKIQKKLADEDTEDRLNEELYDYLDYFNLPEDKGKTDE